MHKYASETSRVENSREAAVHVTLQVLHVVDKVLKDRARSNPRIGPTTLPLARGRHKNRLDELQVAEVVDDVRTVVHVDARGLPIRREPRCWCRQPFQHVTLSAVSCGATGEADEMEQVISCFAQNSLGYFGGDLEHVASGGLGVAVAAYKQNGIRSLQRKLDANVWVLASRRPTTTDTDPPG